MVEIELSINTFSMQKENGQIVGKQKSMHSIINTLRNILQDLWKIESFKVK